MVPNLHETTRNEVMNQSMSVFFVCESVLMEEIGRGRRNGRTRNSAPLPSVLLTNNWFLLCVHSIIPNVQ